MNNLRDNQKMAALIFSENVYILDIKKTDVKKGIVSLKEFSKNYDKKKLFHVYIIDILFTYFCKTLMCC